MLLYIGGRSEDFLGQLARFCQLPTRQPVLMITTSGAVCVVVIRIVIAMIVIATIVLVCTLDLLSLIKPLILIIKKIL